MKKQDEIWQFIDKNAKKIMSSLMAFKKVQNMVSKRKSKRKKGAK